MQASPEPSLQPGSAPGNTNDLTAIREQVCERQGDSLDGEA
jgi:hypothetical protein